MVNVPMAAASPAIQKEPGGILASRFQSGPGKSLVV
jgi:hypothetical protein